MIKQTKRGQYSIEMIFVVFIMFGMLVFFYTQFADERLMLTQLSEKSIASLQTQKISDCLTLVEIGGIGADCEFNLIETISGENYTISIHKNSSVISLQSFNGLLFTPFTATLNQSYLNMSHSGTVNFKNGLVVLS